MPSKPRQIRTADGVRLGAATINEERCIAELTELRRAIESWAKDSNYQKQEKVSGHDDNTDMPDQRIYCTGKRSEINVSSGKENHTQRR